MNKYSIKILITGASGFIGSELCNRFSGQHDVLGIDTSKTHEIQNIALNISDITDYKNISKFVKSFNPDIVIHCAGIAHQKIGKLTHKEYIAVNSIATENIANIAVESNPSIHFIFLSSISVYGEKKNIEAITEDYEGKPSSDYALSKLDAEKRLMRLYGSGKLKKLDIFRLAPVYDSMWSLNLDRRVFSPKKLAYLKFGSGEQKMSAISRLNLVDFIEYRLNQEQDNSIDSSFCNIFNICDENPYKFKEIIQIFKKSDYQPNRFVFTIPLIFVWAATRIVGLVFKNKRQWFYSCYDKLAESLVFDNKKMLATGFKPVHTMETVFKK